MTHDQFWSTGAMPIAVTICFGPILVAWIVAELRKPPTDKKDDQH